MQMHSMKQVSFGFLKKNLKNVENK